MTKEDKDLIDDANKWLTRLGLPPMTWYQLKREFEREQKSWGFAYTSNGVKYFN